ncbi:MAG: OmpA family protein [Methylotenera sp.]|nr:OmpA family protein [Methylotenera sp.]MDP1753899.1 OmpA family protein [Methylotenera sp.]MDP1958735.1 OmpA family protein [Methylotenera sp.]MDP3944061.1 OmpA family protein [Methylotenera sp.]
MKKNLVSLAVATSLGLAAFSAYAEDMYRGAWYAVPGVSYMNTDSDLDADNGRGGFLSIGKELSPSWDIQGRLGYNRADEDTNFAGIDGKYKQTTLGLDALYMFSRDKFRPFLLAGLGAARNNVDYDNPADGKKTSWLANVGLGAQYLFNDSFGLQADLRHQWSRAKLGFNNNTLGDNTTETVGNTLFNLGGVFRFGAPAAVPVIAAVEPEPAPYVAPAPVAAPEPKPTAVAVVAPEACLPKFETITLSAERLFGFDKFKLNGDAVVELDVVVATLKEHPEFDVVLVIGHTDRIGSDKYNQKLSEQRANVIKQHLVSHGIEASRLRAVGKGKLQPIVACKGIRGKALVECLEPNRRVVIEGQRLHPINECK